MVRKHRSDTSDDEYDTERNNSSWRTRRKSNSSDSDENDRTRDADAGKQKTDHNRGRKDSHRRSDERGKQDEEINDRYNKYEKGSVREDGRVERERGKQDEERIDRFNYEKGSVERGRGKRNRERGDGFEDRGRERHSVRDDDRDKNGDRRIEDGEIFEGKGMGVKKGFEEDRADRIRSDDRDRKHGREKGGLEEGEVKGHRGREVVDDDDDNNRGRSGRDDRDRKHGREKGRHVKVMRQRDKKGNDENRDDRRRSERDDWGDRDRKHRRVKGGHEDFEDKGHRGRDVVDDDDRDQKRIRIERDDGDRKHRRDKGGDGGREYDRSLREKEESDGKKANGDQKVQNPTLLQGGNINVEPANLGRSGGVYIPPFKLARMMKEVEDKSSVEYQRLTWDALRKSINGLVNKVNATNVKNIIPELLSENLIRGRGLFCRSCMKSQMASPGFTDVFAALVAVVNTKFPEVGDLLLRRIIFQIKRAYKSNDKPQLLAAVKFIAHLVNQQVVHELVALELLTLLLDKPTDDSVEVAVGFVTECGSILEDLCPRGLHGIFERFRGILNEGEIDKRVQFLIEGLFAIRKAKFQGYPAVRPELDLVEQEDQLTHKISLQEISLQEEEMEPETTLDIFKLDTQFIENEKRYEEVKKAILGDESEDEADSDAGSEDEEQMALKDETETNFVNLRRTIYQTIMSGVDFEEAGRKLLKIKLEPGQEMELCIMLLECCSQERTYLRYYGLLGQRFCMINKIHQENFEKCFVQQYSMIHRLETNKLRNVAKFFAHLLGTDALPWHVLAYIRLTEEDTTSSSRIFIKILFQELSEHLGIRLLNERLSDPAMQDSFESIFPKDNPKNTRFSINFFTSIGLGGITENLREYLKNMPRLIMQQQKPDDSGSSDSSESDASTAESDSESSSSDESDTDEGSGRGEGDV
ncbi:hypothetical protein RHSIM_Rhsim01G0190300 [Rhododendron simsii]|uniref:MI domain-containing protein n=1 Tax=Rhododendron simsii TaxID=118357 RepID=A0A834HIJ7_RHOSS|nr:hypothetical protein RHSIM_Rhsim01G0190300 [Rhododendron simsii]